MVWVCLGQDRDQEQADVNMVMNSMVSKCWVTKIEKGGWCCSRYENIRDQELEESHPQQRRMGTAS